MFNSHACNQVLWSIILWTTFRWCFGSSRLTINHSLLLRHFFIFSCCSRKVNHLVTIKVLLSRSSTGRRLMILNDWKGLWRTSPLLPYSPRRSFTLRWSDQSTPSDPLPGFLGSTSLSTVAHNLVFTFLAGLGAITEMEIHIEGREARGSLVVATGEVDIVVNSAELVAYLNLLDVWKSNEHICGDPFENLFHSIFSPIWSRLSIFTFYHAWFVSWAKML